MRAAHRRGDWAKGKDGQLVEAVGGSPTVFINGKPVMREGDIYDDGSLLTQGSATVFINNCRVPDDYIDNKRYPLFKARQIIDNLIAQLSDKENTHHANCST